MVSPPSRRPTIVERISMLQMAQSRHSGKVLSNGVRLILPEVIVPSAPPVLVVTKKRHCWLRRKEMVPDVITVRLLDETDW